MLSRHTSVTVSRRKLQLAWGFLWRTCSSFLILRWQAKRWVSWTCFTRPFIFFFFPSTFWQAVYLAGVEVGERSRQTWHTNQAECRWMTLRTCWIQEGMRAEEARLWWPPTSARVIEVSSCNVSNPRMHSPLWKMWNSNLAHCFVSEHLIPSVFFSGLVGMRKSHKAVHCWSCRPRAKLTA